MSLLAWRSPCPGASYHSRTSGHSVGTTTPSKTERLRGQHCTPCWCPSVSLSPLHGQSTPKWGSGCGDLREARPGQAIRHLLTPHPGSACSNFSL